MAAPRAVAGVVFTKVNRTTEHRDGIEGTVDFVTQTWPESGFDADGPRDAFASGVWCPPRSRDPSTCTGNTVYTLSPYSTAEAASPSVASATSTIRSPKYTWGCGVAMARDAVDFVGAPETEFVPRAANHCSAPAD